MLSRSFASTGRGYVSSEALVVEPESRAFRRRIAFV
jgi:hypothetical protein